MAINSKIEWTDHTANLWHGCTKVHAGCDNCYAETLARRWGNDIWGPDKPRKEIKSVWKDLDKMQKEAAESKTIKRVFVGSMMDIFEKPMPMIVRYPDDTWENTGQIREFFFHIIDKGRYPNLFFLLLTKRPSNILKYIPNHWQNENLYRKNIMFGASASNQETYETMARQLGNIDARTFLSLEPQIGPIKLNESIRNVEWIIQGGESGPKKRPFDIEWAKSMRDECKDLRIKYFFKQIDKIQQIPEDLMVREVPDNIIF